MGDGTEKPIKQVKVGEIVLATDPSTGQMTGQPVTATHNNLDNELTNVTVILADGTTETIETTPSHPFWATNVGRWVDAGNLTVGTVLFTPDGGRVVVAAVHTFAGSKWMHDLTVSNVPTYYVLAGATPVLVHNCDGIVYRALAKGEDPSVGLFARDPAAVDVSPLSHVAGKKATPWISTTKSRSVAFDKYDQGHGVVAIDTRTAMRVEDISDGPFPSSRRHSSYARRDQEVLIFQSVPPEAIVGYWPGR